METTFATPILDFQRPLPAPLENRVTGAAAAPFLMMIGTIVVTENYEALAIPFGIVLTLFFHELGHLVAGICIGMRFKGILVGPFAVDRSKTGFTFRLTRFWARGLTYMYPPELSNMRRRLVVCVAGGPVASIVCGTIAIIVGEVIRAGSDSGVGVLELFGIYSIFIGVISLRSFRVGTYAGDGMLLRAFTRSRGNALSLVASYGLVTLHYRNPDGVNWIDRWERVARTNPLTPQYYRDLFAFLEASDSVTAAVLLEKCLAGSAFLSPAERDHLFLAWTRVDLQKAQRWARLIKSPENLSGLVQARMNVAVATASEHADAALHHWRVGLNLIQASPDSSTRRRYEARWLTWKNEIVARLSTDQSRQNDSSMTTLDATAL
ncbi:MAG: M50 family metallopeptidase [Acidobacteria bacterium]|nr:M50 family metallopeptidase [Acidobacteriota bacterium]